MTSTLQKLKIFISANLKDNTLIYSGKKTFLDGDIFYMQISNDEFIHFTYKENIEKILLLKKLQSAGSNFAVSLVYGDFVPSVQLTHLDKEKEISAIKFKTTTLPAHGYIEEVVWREDVDLIDPKEVPIEKASQLLSDAPLKLKNDQDLVIYNN